MRRLRPWRCPATGKAGEKALAAAAPSKTRERRSMFRDGLKLRARICSRSGLTPSALTVEYTLQKSTKHVQVEDRSWTQFNTQTIQTRIAVTWFSVRCAWTVSVQVRRSRVVGVNFVFCCSSDDWWNFMISKRKKSFLKLNPHPWNQSVDLKIALSFWEILPSFSPWNVRATLDYFFVRDTWPKVFRCRLKASAFQRGRDSWRFQGGRGKYRSFAMRISIKTREENSICLNLLSPSNTEQFDRPLSIIRRQSVPSLTWGGGGGG